MKTAPAHGARPGRSPLRKTRMGEAILDITTFCNEACVFCNEGAHAEPCETELRSVLEILLLLKKRGIREINFMGGEVTMRKDLPLLLRWMKKQGFKTGIATNAVKFSDLSFARRILADLTWIEISFHAPNGRIFRGITGRSFYGKFRAGVDNIVKANAELKNAVVLFFTVVINSLNYRHLSNILGQISKIAGGSTYVTHLKFIDPEGSAAANDWIVPDAEAVRRPLNRALALARKKGLPVTVSRLPLCFFPGYEYLSLDAVLSFRKSGTMFLDKQLVGGIKDLKRENRENRAMLDPKCRRCSLYSFCPMLDGKYLKLRGGVKSVRPLKKEPADMAGEIKSKSVFLRIMRRFQEFSI